MVAAVNAERDLEVVSSVLVVLLQQVDVAQAPPSLVVAVVDSDGLLVCLNRLVEPITRHILVRQQRARIGSRGAELRRSAEVVYRLPVVALEGERVADDAPRLRALPVPIEGALRQGAQLGGVAQVPQGGRVHVEAQGPAALVLVQARLPSVDRFSVVRHLEVAPGQQIQHERGAALPGRQQRQRADGLGASVAVEGMQRLPERHE
mmetsp:Transcript_72361/g.209527  ORF Transcript_72361/g.209527 Transcript_72361/m.209527 type:complete len:206 (+) Transcript_72361:387-1004(+)